jgi:hypothetical protein
VLIGICGLHFMAVKRELHVNNVPFPQLHMLENHIHLQARTTPLTPTTMGYLNSLQGSITHNGAVNHQLLPKNQDSEMIITLGRTINCVKDHQFSSLTIFLYAVLSTSEH